MDDDFNDFYDPRPPIKTNSHNPRCSRPVLPVKKTDKNNNPTESLKESSSKELYIPQDYTIEPTEVAKQLINGKKITLVDEEQYHEIIRIIEEKKDTLNVNKYTEIIKYLDSCLDDIIKTNFQIQELELIRLEIGHAKTDYNIFKHKMQAKEANLMETLENHLNCIKEKHKNELESCECNKEMLLEKQRLEIEEEELSAENTLKEFHKFVESELKPYKAKIRQLKIQEELANDKDKLWKIKHGNTSALYNKSKHPQITKPSLT